MHFKLLSGKMAAILSRGEMKDPDHEIITEIVNWCLLTHATKAGVLKRTIMETCLELEGSAEARYRWSLQDY